MPSSASTRAARLALTVLLGAMALGSAAFTATPAAQHRAVGLAQIVAGAAVPACSACTGGF